MPAVADLLRFVLDLAGDEALRHRFGEAPEAVFEAGVDDPAGVTGEDVEAVVAVLRRRLPPALADRARVEPPVRPVGAETPRDAALRVLVGLCDALDGPAVEPVTLPHRELVPDPPPPATVAQGGGAPVPTEPPGGRWLHPVIPDDEP